jgi:hypothetical protein
MAIPDNLTCIPRSHLLRPSDTEVKFFVGNENYSPNPRKPFIHAAVDSGPGHHDLTQIQQVKAIFLKLRQQC